MHALIEEILRTKFLAPFAIILLPNSLGGKIKLVFFPSEVIFLNCSFRVVGVRYCPESK